jgi:hypothetical protein
MPIFIPIFLACFLSAEGSVVGTPSGGSVGFQDMISDLVRKFQETTSSPKKNETLVLLGENLTEPPPSRIFSADLINHPEYAQVSEIHNTNIQYLFAMPVERIHVFGPGGKESKALLPYWMMEDLNLLAVELYELFLRDVQSIDGRRDERDASWLIRQFRKWQFETARIGNATELTEFMRLVSDDEKGSRVSELLIQSFNGFTKLLPKIGADFVDRMGPTRGTRFVYKARVWAEVYSPGDARSPELMSKNGAEVFGVVHTHLPTRTKGRPTFEIIDPRGQNPPFGNDQRFIAQEGVAMFLPGWVTRMVPPHRCCKPDNKDSKPYSDIEERVSMLKTHRIDWVFEIGVFGYSVEDMMAYFDYEKCPFKNNNEMNQVFLDLDLEKLVSIRPPQELLERIKKMNGA